MTLIVDDLTIEAEGSAWKVTSEDGRRFFMVDANGQPDTDWFCSFETMKRIGEVIKAERAFNGEDE